MEVRNGILVMPAVPIQVFEKYSLRNFIHRRHILCSQNVKISLVNLFFNFLLGNEIDFWLLEIKTELGFWDPI